MGVLMHPIRVFLRNVARIDRDNLWNVVGMGLIEGVVEVDVGDGLGFENGENLVGGLDFALPWVNRLDGRDDIDACSELLFDQECANLSRRLLIGECAENDSNVAHAPKIACITHQLPTLSEIWISRKTGLPA